MRQQMGSAAVAAAKAVGYVGAGTVEFLVAQDLSFYFLEMNTRLQVEHPITELTTGLDLVRAQIAVAAGESLPWRQDAITAHGHAIECRLYAEDPAHDFRPSLGEILLMREPAGPGIRVDSGIRQGDEVSMHYDPMIAKLSVHGADRDAAIDRARAALRDYAVLGITTNASYLLDILGHPAFRAGQTHTGFLPDHFTDWQADGSDEVTAALVALGVHELASPATGRTTVSSNLSSLGDFNSPWTQLGRFRLGGLG
jgi:acetyl/propionyl-CoA carboxylase alpha subunit